MIKVWHEHLKKVPNSISFEEGLTGQLKERASLFQFYTRSYEFRENTSETVAESFTARRLYVGYEFGLSLLSFFWTFLSKSR